jgi:hypothetical protein
MAPPIYSRGKKPLLQFAVQETNDPKSQKGQMGPLSKSAQVATCPNLSVESIKFAKSSGNPAFKSEGDVFSEQKHSR